MIAFEDLYVRATQVAQALPTVERTMRKKEERCLKARARFVASEAFGLSDWFSDLTVSNVTEAISYCLLPSRLVANPACSVPAL